jgi:hypothetical protein
MINRFSATRSSRPGDKSGGGDANEVQQALVQMVDHQLLRNRMAGERADSRRSPL